MSINFILQIHPPAGRWFHPVSIVLNIILTTTQNWTELPVKKLPSTSIGFWSCPQDNWKILKLVTFCTGFICCGPWTHTPHHPPLQEHSILTSSATLCLCSHQRPPWTSPPQVFTSVHLLKKFVGSRFTISSPRFQNNWVKIHRRKKWDRSRFTKVKFLLWPRFTSLPKNWLHI